jgi:hypothetical protein
MDRGGSPRQDQGGCGGDEPAEALTRAVLVKAFTGKI